MIRAKMVALSTIWLWGVKEHNALRVCYGGIKGA